MINYEYIEDSIIRFNCIFIPFNSYSGGLTDTNFTFVVFGRNVI